VRFAASSACGKTVSAVSFPAVCLSRACLDK
jgi:hypothetical protein